MDMRVRCCSVFATLIFGGSLLAMPEDARDDLQAANELAQKQADAQAFVREVNEVMVLARKGEYGAITAENAQRLDQAQLTIVSLLKDRKSSLELKPDQRIEVYNAQELITSILRNDEKGRIVCTKVSAIGTRVPKRECMSIAKREARARDARGTSNDLLRQTCVPTRDIVSSGPRCTYVNLGL